MFLFTGCTQCCQEHGSEGSLWSQSAQIPENGVIEITCRRGHHNRVVIQQQKFEILSTMAIKAIADGYYRDAVSSFAGALERLYEFFFEATCVKRNIDAQIYASAWSKMSSQSERQLGAFIGIYLLETSQIPEFLPQKQIELRNAVVHKGKFLERTEVVRFGEAVLQCARPILALLSSEPYAAAVQTLVLKKIMGKNDLPSPREITLSTQYITTFFSLSRTARPDDVETAVSKWEEKCGLQKNMEAVLQASAV